MQISLPHLRHSVPAPRWIPRSFTTLQETLHSFPRASWAIVLLLLGIEVLAIALLVMMRDLPNVTAASSWVAPESIVVENREGHDIYYAYSDQDRLAIDRDQIPSHVRQAFIAIEDKRFEERTCIDWRALSRAALANLTEYKSQGASTITQQLVRTAHLNRQKLIRRKVRELVLACELEQTLSKADILNLYLNWIPFGHGIAGIGQASQHYFGKTPSDLSIAEAAILAALPQRPTYFSPYGPHRHTSLTASGRLLIDSGVVQVTTDLPSELTIIGLTGTRAILPSGEELLLGGRAHQVVREMEEQGYIDANTRIAAEVDLYSMQFRPNRRTIKAPHYALDVLSQSRRLLGQSLYDRGGFRVTTTIDPKLQSHAEAVVSETAPRLRDKFGAEHVAVVAADIHTMEILAYVGNTDFFSTGTGAKIDMVRVPRQPGSSFKPFVYAAAMEHSKWTPYTSVKDTPLKKGDHVIHNYDNRYLGHMTVLKALNYSRNTPAVRAFDATGGEEDILSLVADLGAPTPQEHRQRYSSGSQTYDYGWPLAIGAAETPLYEMVQAYATLGRSGLHQPLSGIKDIRTVDGEVLWSPAQIAATQAIDPVIADTITAMLSEERSRPGGYWRQTMHLPDIDAAVKTGTSNICIERRGGDCVEMRARDLWTIGYTPDFVVGVWIGNADGSPLKHNANGLSAATPIWKEVILGAHELHQRPESLFADAKAPYFRQNPPPKKEEAPQQPDINTPPSWIGTAGNSVASAR